MMRVETGSFFILVATLAAGGGAGYVAAQKHVFDRPPGPPAPPPPQDSPPPMVAVSASVAPPAKPVAPVCDDSVGAPGACPTPGYSADEGGCSGLPTKRCNDFKQAMKPRVAERAVACLNALKPIERCDPIRLNLCGHLALMSACQEPDDPDCRVTLAGMSDLGRSKMVSCMDAHCRDKGLLYCEAVIDTK